MNIGDTVYCIDESCYSEHLSKGQPYLVSDTKDEMIRVKNKRGKLVWITALCFSPEVLPELVRVHIDDRIADMLNDCIEVTVTFSDGTQRWLTFMTPEYLKNRFSSFTKYFLGTKLVFVEQLTQELIENCIYEMDRINELTEVSHAY